MEAATRCTEGSCRTASCRPWWGTFRPFYEVPCYIKCASRVHSARGFPHMVCCSGSARTGPADTDLYGTRHLVTTGGSQHILFMYVVSHRQNPWWLSCSAVPAAAACLLKGPAFFFGHSCFGMVCSGLVRSRPAGFDGTRHLVTTRGSQHTVSFKYVEIHHQNPWWLSGSAVPAVAACLLRWPAYFVVHSSFGTSHLWTRQCIASSRLGLA